GGVPIDTRPQMLTGWLRNQPAAGDASIIGIGLFRWNGSSRDTLALGYNVFSDQIPNWQKFSIPIDYMMWEMPDTMNIMFFSSSLISGNIVNGSTIWVDNLSLEYGPVSISNINADKTPSIRPASGPDSYTLTGLGSDVAEISIYNLSGGCVMNLKLAPGQSEIDINASGLKAGLYILRIENKNGSFKSLKFNSI
ncbi:MAG: T9SS type A sorting domain-containing protein, partial [Lentimicrobium sp.]|nr:T9SS type A sorting domain-containing protein [Lentimicrobium sp.]